MRNKQVVRLTESQLHNIIAESVKRVLREGFETISDDDFAALNMNNSFHPQDSYDEITHSAHWQNDFDEKTPNIIRIEVLKPFKYNSGSNGSGFHTSPSGEEVVILPNQIIELNTKQIKQYSARKTVYSGKAKCAHRITRYSHGRQDKMNKGVGYTKLIINGTNALLQGQEEGFIKIV